MTRFNLSGVGLSGGLCAAVLLGVASPSAAQNAIDATRPPARYCGIGLQGSAEVFAVNNPVLSSIFNTQKQQINAAIWSATNASSWKVNLTQDKGSSLALAHLLAYESVDENAYTDPRDGQRYTAVIYSVGINTVLFDTSSQSVRAIVPAIISYSDRITGSLTNDKKIAGFKKLLSDTSDPESATHKWISSLSNFSFSAQENNLSVRPVQISPEAQQELATLGGRSFKLGRFVQRLTTQQEALMAQTFRKTVIPTVIGADGQPLVRAPQDSNKYAVSIPGCFENGELELPPASYAMQLTIEKLEQKTRNHQLGQGAGDQEGEVFQIERGFGGRYKVQWSQLGVEPEPVRADQIFGYSRSVRMRQAINLDATEQYSKLTSNFIREVLEAYASQDKDWVKQNLSASITDKKLRDPNKITKDWKGLFAKDMGVKPPEKEKDDD